MNFVALKLQKYRACKPAAIRFQCRGLRCNSRNSVTLSSSFTFERTHSFFYEIGEHRRFALANCTKIAMKSQLRFIRVSLKLQLQRDKNRLCRRASRMLVSSWLLTYQPIIIEKPVYMHGRYFNPPAGFVMLYISTYLAVMPVSNKK